MTPTDTTAALKLARDDLQSPISRGPTWALIERYADAVCEYNTAVRIDVGIDKAGAALDSMDDFARMKTGVDAMGPRRTLEVFIAQAEAAPAAAAPAKDSHE